MRHGHTRAGPLLQVRAPPTLEMRPGGQPTLAARYCQRSSHWPCRRSRACSRSEYLQGGVGGGGAVGWSQGGGRGEWAAGGAGRPRDTLPHVGRGAGTLSNPQREQHPRPPAAPRVAAVVPHAAGRAAQLAAGAAAGLRALHAIQHIHNVAVQHSGVGIEAAQPGTATRIGAKCKKVSVHAPAWGRAEGQRWRQRPACTGASRRLTRPCC